MGKYTERRKEVHVEKDHTVDPVWRGIGCVLMIVIPMIAFSAAILMLNNESFRSIIPEGLLGTPVLPDFVFKTTPEIQSLILPITGISDLYAILLVGGILTLFVGTIVSFVYALVYRAIGPKTINPFDVARPNVRAKKYKR